MKRAPAIVNVHPMVLLPLKNMTAMPSSMGISVMPNEFPPQKLQYEPTTLTWLVSR